MKIILILGLVALSVAAESLANSSEADHQEWTLFKSRFNKVYKHQREEELRRKLYFEYKSRMNRHNDLYEKGEKSYKFGINEFSDLTDDEIDAKTPCYKQTDEKINKRKKPVVFHERGRLPQTVDWRKKGCVTHVRQQGKCGSCWAFATIETIESHYCLDYDGELLSLSEQNLVDCSNSSYGCSGGLMTLAYEWIKDNGGIATEKDYPYESADGWDRSCIESRVKSVVRVDDFEIVDEGNETALVYAVATVGPVSVAIRVEPSLYRYEGTGVYYDSRCYGNRLSHAVVVVGYGTTPEGDDYWLVRNSWGAQWGDGGYVKMARNKDRVCGIANDASYPVLAY